MSFHKGQRVRFTDKCDPAWYFGPGKAFPTAVVLSLTSDGHAEIFPYTMEGLPADLLKLPFVPLDCIEPIEDDPPAANFIVLPKANVRRLMTRDEAEELVRELTVPAFIAQIVSEHRAVH